MTRKIVFSVGEYYHLYNRGTDKRSIFTDERDRKRFMALLDLCNSYASLHYQKIGQGSASTITDRLTAIGAYCLMPNHFHILVKETTEKGLSTFMHRLATAYTMYFNTKYERTGGLFSGRFKAIHVDNDRYLQYLFAYIHLNPLKIFNPSWPKTWQGANKAELEDSLKEYPYSSYHEYIGSYRSYRSILSRGDFPEYFQQSADFDQFLHEVVEAEPRLDC